MRDICVAALAVISLAVSSYGQTGSIWFGGIELRLGMPKADALAALEHKYDVQALKTQSPDGPVKISDKEWNVRSRGDDREPSAFLVFHDDKLIRADKTLSTTMTPEVAEILEKLFDNLSGGDGKQHTFQAPITTWEVRADNPKTLLHRITLYLDAPTGRSVIITTQEPIGVAAASVASTIQFDERVERSDRPPPTKNDR